MAERMADAVWNGSLKGGKGTFKVGSGAFGGAYSFSTRFEEAPGTNPEELIGAALASCYSMALSASLGEGNFTPESIHTVAKVTLGVIDGKAAITAIHLDTEAKVMGIQKTSSWKLPRLSRRIARFRWRCRMYP